MRLSSPGVPPSSGASTSPLCEAAMPLSYGKRSKSSWRRRVDLIPPANVKAEFYSPYFIVPKKGGRVTANLGLADLEPGSAQAPVQDVNAKTSASWDWFAAINLKDAYFHVSILLRHRPFLRFAFVIRAYQYKVLPFGLSLSPRIFTKVAEAAIVPLRECGIRILNYLDDWQILAQSRDQLCKPRDMVLRHLSLLGLPVNWEKGKLSPVQRISFLCMKLDSVNQTAWLTEEHFQSVLNCLNSFRGRTAAPLKRFQRLLGHMESAATVTPFGLLHMRPIQHWLHGRVPWWAWQSITHRVFITPFSSWTINCICDNIAIWKNTISQPQRLQLYGHVKRESNV